MPYSKADLRDAIIAAFQADGDALYSGNQNIQKYKPDLSGGPGSEVYDANFAAYNYIAEGIVDELETAGYFAAFDAYYTGTGQTLSTSFNPITFNNVRIQDSEYSFNSTKLTINTAGRYMVSYSLGVRAGSGGTNGADARLVKNKTPVPGTRTDVNWQGGGNASTSSPTAILDLNAGDELFVEAQQNAGTTAALQADATTFTVRRAED